MIALNARQSTKVKAALSLIAIHGHNPRTVQQQAQASIAAGTPANKAYSQALEAFANRVPALRSTLDIALELIHHSDDATVSVYDRALTAYNNSGDPTHLDALGPMILEDARALAVSNGEVSEADAAGWDINDALGYNEEAFAAVPDIPDATSEAVGHAPAGTQPSQAPAPAQSSSFQFANPSQGGTEGQQNAPGWGPTGYSPVLAKEAQSGPRANQSMTGYDPFRASQDATGIRVGMTGEHARKWHGTPVGSVPTIQTATGIRIAPTGEQARREAGVPLGPDA